MNQFYCFMCHLVINFYTATIELNIETDRDRIRFRARARLIVQIDGIKREFNNENESQKQKRIEKIIFHSNLPSAHIQ